MDDTTLKCKKCSIFVILLSALIIGDIVYAFYSHQRTDDLKAQIEQLQSEKEQLQAELTQAQADIDRLQPLADKARQMPIRIAYRKAVLGNGYVLIFRNTSRSSLDLKVTLSNPTFNKTKTYQLVVDGGLFKEIGYAQDWTATTGDSVKIECAGYDSLSKTIQPN